MKDVTFDFYPEFYFNGGKNGNTVSFSVTCESKGGFDGYYVSAECDTDLDPQRAVEFRFKCDAARNLAIYSHSLYWVQPAFGNKASDIPEKCLGLFIELDDGTYRYVLTAVGKEYKTYIRGGNEEIVFTMYSQLASPSINNELSFISGTGKSISELSRNGAAAMCSFMNNGLKLREEKQMPEILEYLGWCSWDAFQIRVDHAGLVEKAREFQSKGVPVKYAIIDDMWGDAPNLKTSPADASFNDMVKTMHASSLRSFSADVERFPDGLAAAVADIKANGIDAVGLWFPTTGYWYGLSDGGDAHKMQNGNVAAAAGGRIIAIPEEEPAGRYFDIFCAEAKRFGCDFVKIDNQSCHFFYENRYPIGKSSRVMQKAIDEAAFKHFGGALINCMGMPAECMLNRPMSAVSRCSDDFMPESKPWFAKNILECAYNGLIQGRFYINDWDMWWTDDAQAQKNAVCHAISGGPIYVSDKLGRTVPEVLLPLTYGDGRILRLSDSAYPTEDCIMTDPRTTARPFKIKNSFAGGATVAVFNINAEGKTVSGSVSALDAGLDRKKTYLYYEFFSGDCGFVNGDEDICITLPDNDSVMYFTFVEKTKNRPLFIGRIDKLNSRQAVLEQTDRTVTLYEGGEFAFVCDEDYAVYGEDGREIECERYGIIVTGKCDPDCRVLRFEKYDS